MGYIYKHIRLDKDEPFYVGVSFKNNNFKRSKVYCKRNKIWNSIVSKTKYTVEICFHSDDVDLLIAEEIRLIALYGRIDIKTGILSNMTNGGESTVGWKAGKKFRDRRSELVSGINNPMYGKTHTPEVKEILRQTAKKYYRPDMTQNAILSNIGRKHKSETILKMQLKNGKTRAVYQKTLDGFIIRTWYSLREAKRIGGFNDSKICECCKGFRKSHKGFLWSYNNN